ncbi:hypothetical protein BS47DRAFT_1361764 [Hydnum rufescens UP504]|uniref:SRCR domain-containing protein n=1 Tax=Hydnum rufescens UP504 TaxID=1448309 RepID=A0A9P6AYK9_9AGAM|nr:hypothetical protein BS47DRAFT_1361764 [Hydnum rufescens UP504]
MHRYDFDPFYDVARAWSSPLTWAFFNKLCTRHMYTRNSPHIPYLPQHRFPFQEVVQRGSYVLDFFLGHSWLITMRKALINAFNVYHLWLKAFQFFHLELDQIPVMEHGTHSDIAKALIESGQDGSLLGDMEQSFAKIMAYREIVRIEDTLAEVRAITQLLMHRTLNHIALVAGLELPCFGVNHNLNWSDMVSPFMVSGSWSPEKSILLIPTQGIYLLSPRLSPMGWPNACPDEAHVKHPSLWMIRPIQQKEDYVHQWDVYTAVFESDLRDVDSTMAGALLTRSITLDLRGEEGYSSEEPSDDDFAKKRQCQSIKDRHLEEAQRDPRWAAVTTDFPVAFLGIPGPQERILSIVWEAQKKRRIYHSGLEHYVLERWSSAPPGPPGYPKHAKKRHHSVNADQGPIDRPNSAWHEAKYGPSRGWSWSCSPVWGEEYLESERNCAERNCAERNCAERNCAERNCAERNCAECNCAERNCAERNCAERNCAERNCAEHNCAERNCTESNETAEASPVNLDPPVFVGDWFCIEFSGITGDVNIREVFERLSEDHLFGVHVRKNKGGKGLARLKRSGRTRSPLLPFDGCWIQTMFEMCYAHQQSADDLTLMLENAPACREIGDLRMLHLFPPPLEGDSGIWTFIRYHFLDLHHFPPLVADEVEYPQRMLDRVEFTTAWFLATLDQEYDVIWHRLKMIDECSHGLVQQNLLAFWVPLYITHGLYDVLVHELGRMAKTAVAAGNQAISYSQPSCPCCMEAFGFLNSQVWFIEWDSSSPHPTLFLKAGTPMFSGPR